MAIKLDMEQAYDKMNWDTLREVLHRFGFPPRFCNWVLQCVCGPRFSLLLNGSQSPWIDACCGFRQGCPLSPYLFILCSELLSLAFQQRGPQIGVQIPNTGCRVSHLLYADDILVLAEASPSHAKIVANILTDYCSWTGQRISAAKSSILFSKATPNWRQTRIARMLKFHRVNEFDYLGIRLAPRRLLANDFATLLQKARKKIGAWGNRHLSLAGRITLINFSLLSVPIYLMTHTEVPRSITQAVEKLARDFLWNKGPHRTGLHYVAWRSLCMPRQHGGLGFHMAEDWRGPLRARLAWDFFNKPETVLHTWLYNKYGTPNAKRSFHRFDSISWRILCDGAESLRGITKWQIANGEDINVLHNIWLGDQKLASRPLLMDATELEGKQVADLLNHDLSWNIERLQHLLGPHLTDTISRIPTGFDSGQTRDSVELLYRFSGQTITSLAYTQRFPPAPSFNDWTQKLRMHPRERIFWWRICHDAIPTATWLARRGLCDSELCCWSCDEREDRDHITTGCNFLRRTLQIFGRWGITLPTFSDLNTLIAAIMGLPSSKKNMGRLYCATVYQCWRARNAMKHGRSFGTPSVLAATVLENLQHSDFGPIHGIWDTNRPLGSSIHFLWCPPPPGWMKFNVDGALKPDGSAGIGVVLRNDHGDVLATMGHSFTHWDSGQVELEALLSIGRMLQPWMFDCRGVIIEGDCANMIKHVQHCYNNRRTVQEDLDISFFSAFSQVIFTHVTREANKVADFCASFALHHRLFWQSLDCSLCALSVLIREDKASFVTT